MINLIPGKKGTGKTKILVDSIVKASEKATGNVVCIERGMKLTFDLPHSVRLVDAEDYGITSFETFYGFVAGLLAGNHDIQEVFVDGILKIGGRDYDAVRVFQAQGLARLGLWHRWFRVGRGRREIPHRQQTRL